MYAIYLEKDLDIRRDQRGVSETVPIAQINSVVKTDGGYTLSPLTAYECSMTPPAASAKCRTESPPSVPGKTPARTTLGNLSISFDAESGQLTAPLSLINTSSRPAATPTSPRSSQGGAWHKRPFAPLPSSRPSRRITPIVQTMNGIVAARGRGPPRA